MNKRFGVIGAVLGASLAMLGAPAAASEQSAPEFDPDRRHHFSVVTAGSRLFVKEDEDETAFTLGGDYEYRVNRLIGIGFVIEHAFGAVDATTLLGVTDIHLWRGFAVQAGGGVEWAEGETNAVGRIGGLYEFELENGFTLAPQVHYDFSKEDTLVFGVAFGRAF